MGPLYRNRILTNIQMDPFIEIGFKRGPLYRNRFENGTLNVFWDPHIEIKTARDPYNESKPPQYR